MSTYVMGGGKEIWIKSWLYLVVFYTCSYGLTIWEKNFSISYFVSQVIGFSMLSAFVYLCSKTYSFGKIIFLIFLGLSYFMFFVDLTCFVIFDTPLTGAMIATLFETNFSESLSFIDIYFWQCLLSVICMIVVLLISKLYFSLKWNEKVLSIFGKGLIIFVLIGSIFWIYEFYLIFSRQYACQYRNNISYILPMRYACSFSNALFELGNAKRVFLEYREMLKKLSKEDISKIEIKNPITNIVLLIGESTSRNHMQLYGYHQNTNPLLSQNKNLLLFSDVISPHAQTTLSLSKVLTFSNFESQNKPWYMQENIVAIFRKNLYKTYWISNQLDVTHGGPTGVIASLSDQTYFISKYKKNFDEVFYDERLLFPLDEVLEKNTDRAFFVIHLMGTHASYGNRYPKEFAIFDDSSLDIQERTLARYDNAIVYNDYVVSEILKRFSTSDSLVIYVSDHGEEVYDFRDFLGHSDDKISRFMVEIPMMIYVSDVFKTKHSKLYAQIKQSLNRPYMSDDVIHTLLDLAGIRVQGFEPQRSIINPKFDSTRKRIVGGKDYDQELKKQSS